MIGFKLQHTWKRNIRTTCRPLSTLPEHKTVICAQDLASDEPENESPDLLENEPLLRGRDQPQPYTGVM